MNIVVQNVQQAWQALQQDGRRLLASIAPPVLVIFVMQVIPAPNAVLGAAAIAVAVAAYAVLAVRVHRHVLLPQGGEPAVHTLYGMYAVWAIYITLMAGLVFVPVVMISSRIPAGGIWLLPGLAAGLYLLSRLSLLLPDRAVGGSAAVDRVWAWSRGNGWKLTATLCIPPFLLNFPLASVVSLMQKEIGAAVEAAVSIPIAIFQVALMSCTYRSLKDRGPPAEPAA